MKQQEQEPRVLSDSVNLQLANDPSRASKPCLLREGWHGGDAGQVLYTLVLSEHEQAQGRVSGALEGKRSKFSFQGCSTSHSSQAPVPWV